VSVRRMFPHSNMKKVILLFVSLSIISTACTMFYTAPKFHGIELNIINKTNKGIKTAKIYLTQTFDYTSKKKIGYAIDSIVVKNVIDSLKVEKTFLNKTLNEGYLTAEITLTNHNEIYDQIYNFDCLIGCKKDELEGIYTIEVYDSELKTKIKSKKYQ
jgi:hypothetical protein